VTTRRAATGFTLIELMVVIAVIAILVAIAVTQYTNMLHRSRDATAKGNLAALRSAIRIYYSDNNQYPTDDLTVLTSGESYLPQIPGLKTTAHPIETRAVVQEVDPTETQTWSYNSSDISGIKGHVSVGCLHEDSRGEVWTTY